MAGQTEPVPGELTFRPATPADIERIAEIVAGEPGQEAIGIAGNEALARRFGLAFVRLECRQDWRITILAERDGEVVGVLQAAGDLPQMKVTAEVALLVVRTFGPLRLPGFLRRQQARDRLQMQRPAGAYYISELDVDPGHRNQGIGSALLDYAEEKARAGGLNRMALSTTMVNPARRLYERHGFRVVETRTDADYERYTGIPGRLLMVKEFA